MIDFQHGGAYIINIVVDDAEERLAITMSCQLSVFANSKLDNEATQYFSMASAHAAVTAMHHDPRQRPPEPGSPALLR